MEKIIYIVLQAWGSSVEPVGVDGEPFTDIEEAKSYFEMLVDDYCRANEITRDKLHHVTDTCVRHSISDEDTCIEITERDIKI